MFAAAAAALMLAACSDNVPAETAPAPVQETETETAAPAEESGKTLAERVEAIANDAGKLAPFGADDLADMAAWVKLAKEVWVWYYPNTYTDGKFKAPIVPPVGNFERIAEDIRAMAACKVTGTYFEHDAGGITSRTNLSEMQSWVMFKLFENPSRDVQALMRDFAEHYYGKEGWNVTFSADGSLQSNFQTSEYNDPIQGLEPGDDITFTVTLRSEYEDVTDWYMTNEVLHSLEDADSSATGGAYSYTLTYKGPSEEKVLYTSDTGCGEKEESA